MALVAKRRIRRSVLMYAGVFVVLFNALVLGATFVESVEQAAAGAASQNIRLRAVVRPFCRLSKIHRNMRLRGRTDDGHRLDWKRGGEGGFTLVCNKPYAMHIERNAVFGSPSYIPRRHRAEAAGLSHLDFGRRFAYGFRHSVATSTAAQAFALMASEPGADDEMTERDYEVVVSVDSHGQPMQSTCVMAAGRSASPCHAFDGPDSAMLPLPRLETRMTVTRSTERTPAVAFSAEDLMREILLSQQHDAAAEAGDDATEFLEEYSSLRRRKIGDALTVSVTAKY